MTQKSSVVKQGYSCDTLNKGTVRRRWSVQTEDLAYEFGQDGSAKIMC